MKSAVESLDLLLNEKLIPNIIGIPVSEELRKIVSLPIRFVVLVFSLFVRCVLDHVSSVKATKSLVDAIILQERESPPEMRHQQISVLPLEDEKKCLCKLEFCEAIAIRYGLSVSNLLRTCVWSSVYN